MDRVQLISLSHVLHDLTLLPILETRYASNSCGCSVNNNDDDDDKTCNKGTGFRFFKKSCVFISGAEALDQFQSVSGYKNTELKLEIWDLAKAVNAHFIVESMGREDCLFYVVQREPRPIAYFLLLRSTSWEIRFILKIKAHCSFILHDPIVCPFENKC